MAIPFLSDIRLPSSGKVYLWTGHNSNFLQYNLWHASASGGMFIKNISSSGDIYFQTNSTTALTLDSSQNATFAGDVTVTGGDITLGTDSIASNINAVGDVLAFKVDSNENTGGTPNIQFKVGSATELTINGSSATFAGDIYTKNLKLGNGSTDSSIQLDGDFGGGDLTIQNLGNNKDILFKGNDDGTAITALTLDMSEAGKATFNNDVVAFSDRKLKDNIKTLDGKKVLDMRGVSFTRKDTGLASSGVIAQEIQEVAPELVNETNGTLGVSYGNLVGYLIEAIKDQQKQIDELKEMCNGCSR